LQHHSVWADNQYHQQPGYFKEGAIGPWRHAVRGKTAMPMAPDSLPWDLM